MRVSRVKTIVRTVNYANCICNKRTTSIVPVDRKCRWFSGSIPIHTQTVCAITCCCCSQRMTISVIAAIKGTTNKARGPSYSQYVWRCRFSKNSSIRISATHSKKDTTPWSGTWCTGYCCLESEICGGIVWFDGSNVLTIQCGIPCCVTRCKWDIIWTVKRSGRQNGFHVCRHYGTAKIFGEKCCCFCLIGKQASR